ncbi:hypothetical protein COLO4_31704 [Corchorus olitorius]|uniref:Gnk2-homologous domain-containing protein n=1 Tax=Corchorus olitorius TaxID=93759 RepID=A0A1R3H3K5_9ROSI|nr:hypothetical protein COLO4_31704 [Corchorus olitorius]
MLSFNIISKVFVIFFFLKFNLTPEAAPIFLYQDCTNTTSFTPNSTFQRNLNFLLSSLSSNSTRENRFYNLSVGIDPENIAYGLFLCRGDAPKEICQDCVGTAVKDIVQHCPNDRAAIITYEECMLRYSNENFFGRVELKPALQQTNVLNVSQQGEFRELLEKTTLNITAMIANDRSGRLFATEESPSDFSSNASLTIYALGQCTQDLSVAACNECLADAFSYFLPGCCGVREGARIIFPSCNFRYELYPFYNVTSAPRFLPPPRKGNKSSGKIVGVIAAIVAFVGLLIAVFCFLKWKRRQRNKDIEEQTAVNDITTVESLQFDFGTIEAATNKFSYKNKLGEGGFGEVYKGILPSGHEIAVKRLSGRSGQGDKEFKNEVAVVAKLQHRNLVRLLGFCLEGVERLLVYEYVPNRSLDRFLFEYAMHGQFSVKSDVYSFGVSVLETVSGKRTNNFRQGDGYEDMLTYSWKLWSDGAPLELLDPTLRDSYSGDEVVKCIQIGLLCVQEDPSKRPTMTTIVLMLNSHIDLASEEPQRPVSFFHYNEFIDSKNQSRLLSIPSSMNGISISETFPR